MEQYYIYTIHFLDCENFIKLREGEKQLLMSLMSIFAIPESKL